MKGRGQVGFSEYEVRSGVCLPDRLEGMSQALLSNQTQLGPNGHWVLQPLSS